ncbi:glycine-rich domain-containing protein [Actinoplanes friuliensis]|uniref:glycine-rich domain-containing protein n=1 Tax=Actinoplanes friuliensis TaxID=196914 RepID=UPI0011DE4BEC|nr:hypothetical protein [Actinoplanes friuliensis]
MALFRLRQGGRRVTVVDAYQFPGSVRQRFASEHPALTADTIKTVEAGTRQWFRLAARHPKARLAMPSVVVDDLWHELVLHTREYAEFCDAAFGRFLHHTPEASTSGGLKETFRLAKQDEEGAVLPLIFRVDHDLGVPGGRHYLADCGGRGLCYELKGTVCIEHLAGPGKRPGGGWDFKRNAPDGGMSQAGGDPGGGCGGGCGGGN